MNYEEMLNARRNTGNKGLDMPFGVLRQIQVEQKYRYMVALKLTLADVPAFREALERNHTWSMGHGGQHQLQYELRNDGTLLLEQGVYTTLAQLLDDSPAIVAAQGFTEQLIAQLMDYGEKLNSANVYQLNFAPQNIVMRKNSTTPLILWHGSFYTEENASERYVKDLFEGCEQFIAPEVLAGGKGTRASDVYSLGKLIEWLFDKGGMTMEYRMLVKKATAENPADRFPTVRQMKESLAQKRNMRRSLITLAAAAAIALLCVWLYMDFMPQRSDIEFVEPAKKAAEEDMFADTYDPDVEMILDGDTINITSEDMDMYNQKAEEIFRRRYEEAAEEKLSAVFDNASMGTNEKEIIADGKAMHDDLENIQGALAEDFGINPERAAEIAKDVLEEKMAKRKKNIEKQE